MRNSRKGLLALGLLAAVSTAAIAAGSYLTYPQVGEPSFCASSNPNGVGVGGNTGQQGSPVNCVQTVPAGPPNLTGTEIVPADTNTGTSSPPQEVTIPIVLFGAGDYTYQTNFGVSSYTIPNNTNAYLLDPTGTAANITLTMPPSPLVGQMLRISSTHTITAFNLVANTGQTLQEAPTILTVSTTGAYGYDYIWTGAPIGWIRLQ